MYGCDDDDNDDYDNDDAGIPLAGILFVDMQMFSAAPKLSQK